MVEPAQQPARGRAWVVGDDLNTDVLHPPQFFSLDPEVVKAGLFHGIEPRWQSLVRPGDVIVAGRNFGCGSSRETSVRSLLLNGIVAILAVDFARIFFRSATNLGLPCLRPRDASALGHIRTGDELTLCLPALVFDARGREIELARSSSFVRRIWAAGGLLELLE